MERNEHFRLGLEYMLTLLPKGTIASICKLTGVQISNFSAALKGRRPFPKKARPIIAKALSLTERDLERLGMDVAAGETDSLLAAKLAEKKLLLPEVDAEPDIDIYSVNIETFDQDLVGEAWSLDENCVLAQFTKEPPYQAKYLFRPKPKEITLEGLPEGNDVVGQVEE